MMGESSPTASSPRTTPEVIVALDYPDPGQAFDLVEKLPEGTWYKVGLELFTRAGPEVVERLIDQGRHVFLDLKLHDIPNTVSRRTPRAAAPLTAPATVLGMSCSLRSRKTCRP